MEAKSKNPYLRRLDSEMVKIVQEIQSGLLTIRGACIKYGLCRGTLKLFITKHSIRTFDGGQSNQLLLSMNEEQLNKALNKRIQELTKDLEYAKLKIIGL